MRTAGRRGIITAVMLCSLTFTGCFSGRAFQANYPGGDYGQGFVGNPAIPGECSHCRNRPPSGNPFWPDAGQPVPSGPVAKRVENAWPSGRVPNQTAPLAHNSSLRPPAPAPNGFPYQGPSGIIPVSHPAPGSPQSVYPTKVGQVMGGPVPGSSVPAQHMPYAPGNGPITTYGPPGVPVDPQLLNGEHPPGPPGIPGPGPIPTELARVSLPPYTIAPPDILLIDALRLVPKPPYLIEAMEVLLINVEGTLPGSPITGQFMVAPEGTVFLGPAYGSVRVGGLTLDQANAAIRSHLARTLTNPVVTVALAQIRAFQQIRGEHLVRPDGTISLGTYGSVYVTGLTLGGVKCVLEKYLADYVVDPKISVDVFAYNSKVYYVIVDGAGFGQQVFTLPITGNETVLDAIGKVGGLAPQSSKRRIWVARPSPCHNGCNQILPVDWRALTEGGSTCTNYQIFPGDRVYISPDRLILVDNLIGKVFAPIERVLGITFLGVSTYQAFGNNVFGNNN